MSSTLSPEYWDNRYKNDETGWDIGHPSPPLMDYALNTIDKENKILIPGAGNGYEFEALIKAGYHNTFSIDVSETAVQALRSRVHKDFLAQVIKGDFFEHGSSYDFVLEQTFFCALEPRFREQYVRQTAHLLNKDGILAGVLFDFELTEQGPPFGGSKAEYKALFVPAFEILHLERCTNSIKPRQGSELFIEMKKK